MIYQGGQWVLPLPPLPTFLQLEACRFGYNLTATRNHGVTRIAQRQLLYVGSMVNRFNNEAVALRDWRDQTWVAAETLLAQIQGGLAQIPATVAAALALMPAPPVRPT